jgi:electron transfer flavoprotein beta subunit
MKRPLNVAVLVSPARHPLSGQPLRSVSDAAAFEIGCSLVAPERLTVLYAGMASSAVLNDYLGLGAAAIEVLAVAEPHDVLPALLGRLKDFDIVLCGTRSDGQFGSGMLPYLLAEALQVPLVSDVLEAELAAATLSLRQFLPKGRRRRLEVSTPVVLAVHARAPQTRQYAYARARAGRVFYTAPLGGSAPQPAAWQFEPVTRRPRTLKAQVVRSGHSRMLGAIGGAGSAAAGGRIVNEGSAQQKARLLLDYLREHRLIDF